MTTDKKEKNKETTSPYGDKTLVIKKNRKVIFKGDNKEIGEMTREEWQKFYRQTDLL